MPCPGVQNARFLTGSARQLLQTYVAEDRDLTNQTMAVVNLNRNGLTPSEGPAALQPHLKDLRPYSPI
ncbi:hypothetical protein ACOMHN_007999 [Nucella lapillus]